MAISKDPVSFTIDGATYEGMHVRDQKAGGDQPCILILHHWAGRKDDMIAFAEDIANWGYAAFACDIYGQGKFGSTPDENRDLMGPLVGDRSLPATPTPANLEAAAGQPRG